ncbi:MAG: PKD domain-containing protein [Chloroflexi bacterium]|nr:PKD domain-containing protein [Chloroflexota bacterium]MBU1750233.1 PKD domain-containing protein [Chloroflexota bacterium]
MNTCHRLGIALGAMLALLALTGLALGAPTADPDARFTPSATDVCVDWPITLFNQSQGTTPITFHWSFGDGRESWGISPVYSYTTAGTYTVVLTATNALGSDVATATIGVRPRPTVLFTYTPALIYINTVVQFQDQSAGEPTAWTWDLGDGTIITGTPAPTHTFAATGAFSVALAAANECGPDVRTALVPVVAGLPVPDFTPRAITVDVGITVCWTNHTVGTPPIAYEWGLGDGMTTTVTAPCHAYLITGTHAVVLTATNGYGTTIATGTVTAIARPPLADFAPRHASTGPGFAVTWANHSTGTLPLAYTWEFGDGVTSTVSNPSHTYALTGTWGLTLTARNAYGTDVVTGTVRVEHHALCLPLVLRDYSPPVQIEYGANLADLGNADLMNDIGFTWVKGFLEWKRAEPSPGNYFWGDVDNVLAVCSARDLKLLLRVDRPPAWANGTGDTAPPYNAADYGAFMGALAVHCRGQLDGIAYEVWNEPNLEIEWGGQPPDPARYTRLLKAAYPRVKAADPDARIVTAGLATTGGTLTGNKLTTTAKGMAYNDLHYIQAMYNAGAKGYFDALGSPPYGFAYAPAHSPTDPAVNGLCFRRAEQQRAVMVANDDSDTPIWLTEFGWLLDPAIDGLNCSGWGSWPSREWQIVNPQTQVTYLVDAYAYANQHWPWMGVMCMFNLDFGADYYQAGCPSAWAMCNEMRYYSLVYRASPCDPGNSPRQFRPAYWALKAMPK